MGVDGKKLIQSKLDKVDKMMMLSECNNTYHNTYKKFLQMTTLIHHVSYQKLRKFNVPFLVYTLFHNFYQIIFVLFGK